ncbi:sulfatase family protein [Pleomorphovibrio marinus]|uniref:sulfatase family protein n=1 Tax=Pleomorphovibrio marinus TaxID=2164132 RepID=UPI000E0BA807|nr:arylsulfatase [Pleomorphovibrio marinus]
MRLLLCYTLYLVLSPTFAQTKPNIVYILADDLGIGDVSAYNPDSKIDTKYIDWMAQNGIMFTDAHTSSSVCTPTRYGILTGRYNWRSRLKKGVLSGYSKPLIEPERLTVAHFLQSHGYHTAFLGKWHLGWDWGFSDETQGLDNLGNVFEIDYGQPIKNGPRSAGFDFSYGFSGSLDMPPYVYVQNDTVTAAPNRITRNMDEKGFWREGETGADFDHVKVLPHLTTKAIDFIHEHGASDSPFFLYFALPAPHTPILPTTEFMGQSNTNLYGDFMLQVDDVVGQVVQALKAIGKLENTLLIFVSDNGCSPRASFPELERVGHHPSHIYRGHKADIYEGGHRVPFLVHWPEVVATPRVSDRLVCTTDLMATVAELMDSTLPVNVGEDSFSFLDVIRGGRGYERRESIIHHSIEGRFAIRRDKWKLILWPGSGGWSEPMTNQGLEGLPPYQLFDLASDPGEKENRLEMQPERVEELKTEIVQLIREGRSNAGPVQSNDGEVPWEQVKWAFEE